METSISKGWILITGCSSGIGLDAARTLKGRGYQVIATARKEQDVKLLHEDGFDSFLLDLEREQSIEEAFAKILEKTGGRIDFLFNNGAYGQPGAVEDLETNVLRKQFEINVFGWHHLTRLVIKVMRERGGGRIVQNSSVLGFVCMPYRGAYNASKFAIEGLTDTLRLELADTNIKLSLIEPGPIRTRFRANALTAFKNNVDWENSVHASKYRDQIKRMEKEGAAVPFTLEPEAVTKALIHALESKSPKARYAVTTPTKLFAFLKRILTTKALDRLLIKG